MQSGRIQSRQMHTSQRFAVSWLIVVVALFPAGVIAEGSDGRDLLARMSTAMRSLDYQGSFTYQHAGRVDTLRVFHVGGARERERLISLNGPRTELIRDGLNVTCIQADGSAIVYTSNSGRGLLPLVPNTGTSTLGEHYDVSVVGSDRVAGYAADMIDIIPRDRYRYGYRLWIDQGTSLLLRSIVTDSERRPLEQFMFVSLEIGAAPNETDLLPRQHEMLTTTAAPATELPVRGPPIWRTDKAPPGFTLVSARRPVQASKGAEHLVYSDGLASVSIYVEPRGDAAAGIDTMSGRGTLNVYTHVEGDWRITVLGDVPSVTVGAIAQSVTRTDPSAVD